MTPPFEAPCPHCGKTLDKLDDYAWAAYQDVMLIECWHCFKPVDIVRGPDGYKAVVGD